MRAFELLLELTDKVKNLLHDRYTKENPDVDPNTISQYLDKWDQYISGLPKNQRDITRLNWDQVKQLIDDAEFRTELKGKQKTNTVQDKPVYDNNDIFIYKGDNKPKCIQYGRGYTWCISRADASNLFYSYRMRQNEPVFYFVFDKSKPKTDRLHAVVIYVTTDGRYFMDTADNKGDKEYSWDELIQLMPKLAPTKPVFKTQPLSNDEREEYEKYEEERDLDEYEEMSLQEKYKYFMFGHELTDEQQSITPPELLGVYAKNHIPSITDETWSRLKPGDKKKIQYDAAQHGLTAAAFAVNILDQPWFITGLPYAMNSDRLINNAQNNAEDDYYFEKYFNLVDWVLMNRTQRAKVFEWMETANVEWIADLISLYWRLPLFEINNKRLFEILKQVYKQEIKRDDKFSIRERLYKAPSSADPAIAQFVSWCVMSQKDPSYLDRYVTKESVLNQIRLSVYRRALKHGAKESTFPKEILERLKRTRNTKSRKPREKWVEQLELLKQLMRENEILLHSLDVNNMDGTPDYMKEIIKDYQQKLLSGEI